MREMTFDQLAAACRGALRVEPEGDGIVFRRFGPEASDYWDRTPGWRIRSRCPAGVRIAFRTDADRLRLRADLGHFARPAARFDGYVDGLCAFTVGVGTPEADSLDAEVALGDPAAATGDDGLRHVAIYLPQMRMVTGLSIALPDAARYEPAEPDRLWLALGDSITQGMTTPFPSLTYPSVAARRLGLDLHNAGVGGAVFDEHAIPERPTELEPAAVTVAFGVNDFNGGRPVEAAEAYLRALRDHYPETPTAVFEPLWAAAGDEDPMRRNDRGLTFAEYRSALRAIVADLGGLAWVPRGRLTPPGPAVTVDGCHPDTAGFAFYAEGASAALNDLLAT
jgi:lysophospholipase L1-like esterase